MATGNFYGLHTAVTTAVSDDLAPDFERTLAHWRTVLNHGSHGICPFGTTGEGVAFSVSDRIALLEAAVSFDIPVERIMPVVGSNSVTHAVELASHAHSLGCPGILILPPSYYKNPSDKGIFEFYARVISRIDDHSLRLFVYNIPQVTGVVIEHTVVDQLIARFGPVVAGIKDSWGKLDHTLAYIKTFPELAIFTGTDHHIVECMRAGGAGTITGMGNVNSRALRNVINDYVTPDGQELCHIADEIHLVVEKFGGVPAMKAVIAHYRSDDHWRTMTPPLVSLSRERQAALVEALKAAGHVWPSAR